MMHPKRLRTKNKNKRSRRRYTAKFLHQEITEGTEDSLTKFLTESCFAGWFAKNALLSMLRLPEARLVSLKFHGKVRPWKRVELCILVLRRNSTSDPGKNRWPWRTPIAQNFHLKQYRRIFGPCGPPL